MKKILFLSDCLSEESFGGSMIARRNVNLLSKWFDVDAKMVEPHGNGLIRLIRKLLFFMPYCCFVNENGVSKNICKLYDNYDYVFFDRSFIDVKVPSGKSIVHFHNVEKNYELYVKKYVGNSKLKNYLRKKLNYLNVCYIEKRAYRKSICNITLNKRDADELKHYYGDMSEKTFILPSSLNDNYEEEKDNLDVSYQNCLFVGSNFGPNIEGINWFIDNVLPYVNVNLIIVGNGMDKADIHRHDRVKVYGFVDDLAQFYYKAGFVISPIFSGSGMKTKTAEAFEYGRLVVGTTEAFAGYEDIVNRGAGMLCNRSKEFIDTIQELCKKEYRFCKEARIAYEENYSINASKRRMEEIVNFIEKSS